jgi:proteasome lid subunit RPN8/RPN11
MAVATPPQFQLLLPALMLEEMIAHAQATLPNECCGLLAGRLPSGDAPAAQVLALGRYPLENELNSPREYRSEPRSMFAAMRAMLEQKTDVIAVYHSHPASPPVPSRKDLEQSYSEQVINFIISLAGPDPQVRGWWLRESDYEPASWRLV